MFTNVLKVLSPSLQNIRQECISQSRKIQRFSREGFVQKEQRRQELNYTKLKNLINNPEAFNSIKERRKFVSTIFRSHWS